MPLNAHKFVALYNFTWCGTKTKITSGTVRFHSTDVKSNDGYKTYFWYVFLYVDIFISAAKLRHFNMGDIDRLAFAASPQWSVNELQLFSAPS